MRVIAGTFRSRRLESIPGDATRPTADRVREALFNILQTRIAGASFVDAYAGTGAVGIEALSRGAAHAWFLERDRRALDTIRKNLASLGLERQATVLAGKVLVTLARCPAGIVFLDPPYDQADEYAGALDALAGREVILIPDNDRPGRERAARIARALLGRVNRLVILELEGAKDVPEWFETGHGELELIELVEKGLATPA